ncbi:MAG: hypothetical protein K1X94_16415 [Sandaracinaceae bacterium]|nr:hypothetical protein [Sandaracinaceae bacterium]
MWGRVLVALFLFVALAVGVVAALGIEVVGRQAVADDPRSGETATFDEVAAAYDASFGAHVHDDGVDWATLSADPTGMRALGALYARSGPVSGSLGATGDAAALAFRIDAYDALVGLGIVEHTVARGAALASVDDVHGVIDPGDGFGFFTAQIFVLDHSLTNLDDLRRLILRSGDARVLGLLHDGRRGAPLPPARAIREADLEASLAGSGLAMTEPPFVSIDRSAHEIVLAPFFEEERLLFESHARALGELPTVSAWIAHHARSPVRDALSRAEAEGYTVRHATRDRALSQSGPAR